MSPEVLIAKRKITYHYSPFIPVGKVSAGVYNMAMYVGVDVGGTKTLVAALDSHGVITEHQKFPTPQIYEDWLSELEAVARGLSTRHYQAGAIALPGEIERATGRGVWFGNLKWHTPVSVQNDVERIFECPIAIENDAKLGGLSEALLINKKFKRVLYVTVSTGIGIALIEDGKIYEHFGDHGGQVVQLEHRGKRVTWESFASGHAIVERYHKKAMDITDEATWRVISRNIAQGLIELVAILEPEAIVIGGSVGTYFERYGQLLTEALQAYKLPLVTMPILLGAQRPEEAVAYGCYDYAKQIQQKNHAGTTH